MHPGDDPIESQEAGAGPVRSRPRPRPTAQNDRGALQVSLVAARGLLRAGSADEAAAIVAEAVRALGGELEAPSARSPRQLPLDVTFGTGDPLVPAADSEALDRLRVVLPAVIEDAHVALGRIRRESHLAASAGTDVLTGLPDRRIGMRVLGRLEEGDVLAMIDLDRFKDVNDELGHEAGDEVLRSFAAALRRVVRAADTAARLGGEEFLLLLPRTSLEGAGAVLERLRQTWSEDRPQPITFSAGLAVVGPDGGQRALTAADRALYAAKRGGRDRVEVAP